MAWRGPHRNINWQARADFLCCFPPAKPDFEIHAGAPFATRVILFVTVCPVGWGGWESRRQRSLRCCPGAFGCPGTRDHPRKHRQAGEDNSHAEPTPSHLAHGTPHSGSAYQPWSKPAMAAAAPAIAAATRPKKSKDVCGVINKDRSSCSDTRGPVTAEPQRSAIRLG